MQLPAFFVSRRLGGARPVAGAVASLLLVFGIAAQATTAADSFSEAMTASRSGAAPQSLAAVATDDRSSSGAYSERTSGAIFSGLRPLPAFVPVGASAGDGLFMLPGTESAAPAGLGTAPTVFSDGTPPNTAHVVFFGSGGPRLIGGYVSPNGVGSLTFAGVVINAGELIEVSKLLPGNRTPTEGDMGPAERAGRAAAAAEGSERAGFIPASFRISADMPSLPALIAVALLSVLGVLSFLYFRWRQRQLMRAW